MPTTPVVTTARDLGDWVRQQLEGDSPDASHIARVVTQELGRWFGSGAGGASPADAASVPPATGSAQWDAFLEGAVAYLFHCRGLTAPGWTARTSLDTGWAPNDFYSVDWHLVNVLSTPVELLDKGVVFAQSNFERL